MFQYLGRENDIKRVFRRIALTVAEEPEIRTSPFYVRGLVRCLGKQGPIRRPSSTEVDKPQGFISSVLGQSNEKIGKVQVIIVRDSWSYSLADKLLPLQHDKMFWISGHFFPYFRMAGILNGSVGVVIITIDEHFKAVVHHLTPVRDFTQVGNAIRPFQC